jgi:hypothetical protein
MTSLFVRRDFVSHGGLALSWKVECDALTSSDWLTLASIVAGWGLRFGHVVGVPQGGLRFADALRPHVTAGVETTLIADDVLTTGGSMEGTRCGVADCIGVVAFARVTPPPWVRAVWQMGTGR